MSKVLIVKHLPSNLPYEEREKMLKHFGAVKVWQPAKKQNYLFAAFSSVEKAKESLHRLHQLEMAQRRLVVEFSFEKEPITHFKHTDNTNSATTNYIKEFIETLNAFNPSVDFYQPPPAHLTYKYPNINPSIAVNIITALFQHKPFYVQALHLMNKMSLDLPFKDNEVALSFFKETFREFFIDEIAIVPPEEPESEISSEEEGRSQNPMPTMSELIKRKHSLPKTRKRPAAVLSTANLPKPKKTKEHKDQVVFEVVAPKETKKISLVVSQDALQKPSDEPEIVGEIGKFEKETKPDEEQKVKEQPELPTISKQELMQHRISFNDMKVLPVFKNYHPGQPSMRLYIKNLAKTVTGQDLNRIYKRYVEDISEEEQIGFDLRLMQEGRMKGQAFVTFPSVSIAEMALNETNGYLLKEKPMVVQFARVATSNPVE